MDINCQWGACEDHEVEAIATVYGPDEEVLARVCAEGARQARAKGFIVKRDI